MTRRQELSHYADEAVLGLTAGTPGQSILDYRSHQIIRHLYEFCQNISVVQHLQ